MFRKLALVLAACLLASGCDDSVNPLSDPDTSKVDERLIGLWRESTAEGDDFYHVGRAGEGFPKGMLRIVTTSHQKGTVTMGEDYLAFATVLGEKTFLNVIGGDQDECVRKLNRKGWLPPLVDGYTLMRYAFDGEKLTLWGVDERAKETAIQSRKIKGLLKNDAPAKITDTTENLARFVVEAGERFFDRTEVSRLTRVPLNTKP